MQCCQPCTAGGIPLLHLHVLLPQSKLLVSVKLNVPPFQPFFLLSCRLPARHRHQQHHSGRPVSPAAAPTRHSTAASIATCLLQPLQEWLLRLPAACGCRHSLLPLRPAIPAALLLRRRHQRVSAGCCHTAGRTVCRGLPAGVLSHLRAQLVAAQQCQRHAECECGSACSCAAAAGTGGVPAGVQAGGVRLPVCELRLQQQGLPAARGGCCCGLQVRTRR